MTPHALASRLLGHPAADLDPDLHERVAIYRSNYAGGLIRALAQSFPVVRLMVGRDYFEALACDFIAVHPPRSPVLARYGGAFARFLEAAPVALDVPYAPDVARLEYARIHAWHAADAPRFNDFSETGIAWLLHRRIAGHPAMTLVASPYPVGQLWEIHQLDPPGMLLDWAAQTIVVHRSHDTVVQTPIDAGAEQFLVRLLASPSLGAALGTCATTAEAQAALQVTLRLLMTEGLVAADPDEPEHDEIKAYLQ